MEVTFLQSTAKPANTKSILALLLLAAYVVLAAYFAGIISTSIAYSLTFLGVIIPIREPINLGLVFVFYWLILKYKPDLVQSKMPIGGGWGVMFGIATTLVLLAIVWLFLFLLGILRIIDLRVMDTQATIGIFTGLLFVFLHGLSEQWLIQKLGQQIFTSHFGKWVGVICAGIMFAALQALQGYSEPIYVVNSLVFGVFMAILALRFGVIAAASAHCIWTWTEVVLLPALFDFEFRQGTATVHGLDSYGSPIFTIVVVILCLILGFVSNMFYNPNDDKIKHKPNS
jgi:membrane protease YdiL (CAAX protease family)